ncbi:MAG: histidine phosphatase family protein [Nitrospirae bacterium]|nr:histidine phosphatase family protein [Nitrospirota bacterium]
MVTTLYLIRHGQILNHNEWRFTGHLDIEMDETGISQFYAIADCLSRYDIRAVYSSDLRRSLKGAELIANKLNISSFINPSFRELSFGKWEGLKAEEIPEPIPEDLTDFRFGGGETIRELQQRVIPALKDIISRHKGEEITLVGHGGVNRIILLDALGVEPKNFYRIKQEYGCLNIIEYAENGFASVRLINGGPCPRH